MIRIIKAEKIHIKDIVKLHKSVVKATNSKHYAKDVINEWLGQINEGNVRAQLENESNEWYLAVSNGTIEGFTQFHKDDGILYQINVRPDFQNKGVGKKLFEFAKEKFIKAGCRTITLNSTLGSVKFYEKLGFTAVGEIFFDLDKTKVKMMEMIKYL